MKIIDGATLGKSYDCKTPHCTGAARSPVGRYSYCDTCQARRARAKAAVPAGGFTAQLDQLKTLAKRADRARTEAETLTRKALAKKAEADKLADELRQRSREFLTT